MYMSLYYEQLVVLAILVFTLAIFTLGKSPVFRVDRTGSVIVGSVIILAFGFVSFDQAIGFVDFRTIVILFCMMLVVANLKVAGLFEFLGALILQRVRSERVLLAVVIVSTGFMSAVAINDIICLLFTPVVLLICRQLCIDAKPYLIAVAMSSNIGSAATLLGNPQNILVGSLSQLNLFKYVLAVLPIVLVGLLITYVVIYWLYKDSMQDEICAHIATGLHYHKYLLLKGLLVLLAIVAGYMAGFDLTLLAMSGAAFLLITRRVNPNKLYTSIDFNLLIMFVGLFIVIGEVEHSGLLKSFLGMLPADITSSFGFFAVLTVVLSNIVSNVPAVLLLQGFVPSEQSAVWWTALALFSTIAGNLTLFGSMANLIVVEIAKREHVQVSSREYLRVGLPVTVLLTVIAYIKLA